MQVADLHNFGKRVEKIRRDSGVWYQKPRTVFWEWLFFGKSSPLAEVFSITGENGESQLAGFLFNLETEVNSEWLGYSREQAEASVERLLPSHFYGFGVLLAYSYIFGIRDLHRQNLVMTETHLQVVDAEVVLTKLVLPSETILLPFKNIGYEFAGIGRLANSPKSLTHDQIREVFAGYFDLFKCAIRRKDEIAHALSDLDLSKHPARVIIRNTPDYLRLLGRTRSQDLMVSESAQMERGDVPYYFKNIGGKSLNWLSSPDTVGEESNLGRFSSDVQRHAQTASVLLEINLSTSQVMAQGAIQLIRHLQNGTEMIPLTFENKIQVNIPSSRIMIDDITYAVK